MSFTLFVILGLIAFVNAQVQYVIVEEFQPNTNCNPSSPLLSLVTTTGCVNTAPGRWDYAQCTNGGLIRRESCNSDCSLCTFNNSAPFQLNTCYEQIMFQCQDTFPKVAQTVPVLAYFNDTSDCPTFASAQQWTLWTNPCLSSVEMTCVNGNPNVAEYSTANCTGKPVFSGPVPQCSGNEGYFCGSSNLFF